MKNYKGIKLKTITLFIILIASSLSHVFAETLYFGSQTQFARNIDYKFFENLSTCHPYATPTNISAPLWFPTGYSKTQIVGVSNNKCVVRNYKKDASSATWKLSEEFQLPIDFSKNLGLLMMRELKNPNERLAHLKKYCELNNLSYSAIKYRLRNGWTLERALHTPVKGFNKGEDVNS